jgi:hypothetical protein
VATPDSIVHDKETSMAYGIIHRFAGANEDQYRASIAAVHPSDGSLPEGQVFHAAGLSDDGWVIVAIHESKESWEKFRDGTLMPRMRPGSRAASKHLRRRPDSRSGTSSPRNAHEKYRRGRAKQ